MDWEKAYDKLFVLDCGKFVATLKLQDIGTYSSGQAWVLWIRRKDETVKQAIGDFWVKDDGYNHATVRSIDKKLWSDIHRIQTRAIEILRTLRYL